MKTTKHKTMENLKKISDNELSELILSTKPIKYELKRYSHVSNLLPIEFTEEINKMFSKLTNEEIRRENEKDILTRQIYNI